MNAFLRIHSRGLPKLGIAAAAAALLAAACDSTGPLVPAKLAFSVQPASTSAAATFTVAVEVQNASGDRVAGATNSISLSLGNAAGAVLLGTTTLGPVNGVATFTDLRIDRPGTGYLLIATSANLTNATSSSFAIAVGPPVKLVFLVQPGLTVSTTPISPPPTVAVQDLAGNTVTSATPSITLTLGFSPGGGTLTGTTVVTAVNGIATFSDLRVDKVGTSYTLAASSINLTGATSAAFSVLNGPPAKLAFTVQPALAPTDGTLTPAVVVEVQDAGGNLALGPSPSVMLELGANPGGGTLSGTTTVATVNGAAIFGNLSINNPGVGYTLVATAGSLTSATSAAFTIRASFTFIAMSPGYFHSCGLVTGNAAYCWGQDGGKLGTGSAGATSLVPVAVTGGISFVTLSAGRDHTCGVTAAGAAYCWGFNGIGQLGDGTTTNRSVPTAVAGGLSFAAVSAGYAHTCGVTVAGAAYCWGGNGSGELGDGTTTTRLIPTAVSGGLSFLVVSSGRLFTCGVTTGNAAHCWGYHGDGALGNGTGISSSVPVPVAGGIAFATVGAGGFHSCGLSTIGAAHCWGSNFAGELGNGTITPALAPVTVSGGLSFVSLSVGNRHSCGVTAAGAAFCWGGNDDGNLGDGTLTNRNTPTAVAGGLIFASVIAARFHTCAVTTGNAGYCWGSNTNGQLGIGSTQSSQLPVRVR